ncbi:MAG: NAD-dependent dehydratase, partial [Acidobacteria bacterium]
TEESALRTKLHVYPPEFLKRLQTVFSWVDDDYDKIPVERTVLGDSSLPGTVLRLPMVYGPGDPLHRFFPVIKRVLDGRGRILFSQDMAAWRAPRGYVENVAAAIALAAVSE